MSIGAAAVLALALENAHRDAVETDYEVAALGRVNALLTEPLEKLGTQRDATPAQIAEIAHVEGDVRFFQNVTALRVYRPDGTSLYPADAPNEHANVARALASDAFVRETENGATTAYSPFYTDRERVYVLAIDFSLGGMTANLQHERNRVFEAVGGVAVVIFLSLVALATGASRELERRRLQARGGFIEVLALMADTIELRDPYTAGHSARVAAYSRELANELGLCEADAQAVEHAALLHDIGKIAVPDSVLFKPGKLDDRERRIMNQHPTIGGELLLRVASMEEIAPCVAHHHERIDGKGYPGTFGGDDIPRGARIIAVADTFDAMTTDRPYRRALSVEVTLAELDRVAGTQLDAAMVEAFKRIVLRGSIAPPKPFDADDLAFGRSGELSVSR